MLLQNLDMLKKNQVHWFGEFFILEICPTTVKIINNLLRYRIHFYRLIDTIRYIKRKGEC